MEVDTGNPASLINVDEYKNKFSHTILIKYNYLNLIIQSPLKKLDVFRRKCLLVVNSASKWANVARAVSLSTPQNNIGETNLCDSLNEIRKKL